MKKKEIVLKFKIFGYLVEEIAKIAFQSTDGLSQNDSERMVIEAARRLMLRYKTHQKLHKPFYVIIYKEKKICEESLGKKIQDAVLAKRLINGARFFYKKICDSAKDVVVGGVSTINFVVDKNNPFLPPKRRRDLLDLYLLKPKEPEDRTYLLKLVDWNLSKPINLENLRKRR